MSDITKIIDERKRQKKAKTERIKEAAQAIAKVWELNGIVARLS